MKVYVMFLQKEFDINIEAFLPDVVDENSPYSYGSVEHNGGRVVLNKLSNESIQKFLYEKANEYNVDTKFITCCKV